MLNQRKASAALIVLLTVMLSVACATPRKANTQDRRELKYNTSSKVGKPKNFAIYKKRSLDRRWLKKGKKHMYSNALDNY